MGKDIPSVDASTKDRSSEKTQQCDFCSEKMLYDNASWKTCAESSDVISKLLAFGRLRGVVNIVGCKAIDLKQDYIQLAGELIKRDFLVATSGCVAVDMEKAGLMGEGAFKWAGEGLSELCDYLGIAPSFYMGSCKKNLEMQKFYKLLADREGVNAGDLPMAVVTLQQHPEQSVIADLHDGTFFYMEKDPVTTIDVIDLHIHNKRIGLEWCDRYHCSEKTYS